MVDIKVFLDELIKKIDSLEDKIILLSEENKELHRVVKYIYEQNYKLVKEIKTSKENKETCREGKASNNK